MGQDRLIRTRWKMLNERSPATVADVVDIILQNRNLDPRAITGELKDLSEHLCIRGMTEGARLLAKHMANRNKIVVVADYDCDGITSAAQIALFFQETGYENFRVVIPSRAEGYGIPERAISENRDAKFLSRSIAARWICKPVRLACSMGADCIVIDHHEVPAGCQGRKQRFAPASVLINPKHPECGSSFKEFCASGLTFLFLAALRRALRSASRPPPSSARWKIPCPRSYRNCRRPRPTGLGKPDLLPEAACAISTQMAAPRFHTWRLPPACAGKTLTAGHIGFYLGPRINAAGRVSEGQIAYDLLTSDQPSRLVRLARELDNLNAQRQAQEEKIVREIRTRLAQCPPNGRTLVLGSAQWQPGVVGIAASRVQQDLAMLL